MDQFCQQVEANGQSLQFYGESDAQYMMNDFRSGIRRFEAFYEEVRKRQSENKFLKNLIEFREAAELARV